MCLWGCSADLGTPCLGLSRLISSHIILFILPDEHYLFYQPNSLLSFLLASANGIHVPVKEMSPTAKQVHKWQHQHWRSCRRFGWLPKLCCVCRSTGQKGWKRKAPHPWLLVLPWGLGSEWLGVEFQLACTGGLPLKRREPQPSFSLLPPAINNPEKLLAIYQDFHQFFLLGHSHDVQKKKLDLRGKDCPHGIVLRRRHSHTGQEKPRTPAPTHI